MGCTDLPSKGFGAPSLSVLELTEHDEDESSMSQTPYVPNCSAAPGTIWPRPGINPSMHDVTAIAHVRMSHRYVTAIAHITLGLKYRVQPRNARHGERLPAHQYPQIRIFNKN